MKRRNGILVGHAGRPITMEEVNKARDGDNHMEFNFATIHRSGKPSDKDYRETSMKLESDGKTLTVHLHRNGSYLGTTLLNEQQFAELREWLAKVKSPTQVGVSQPQQNPKGNAS